MLWGAEGPRGVPPGRNPTQNPPPQNPAQNPAQNPTQNPQKKIFFPQEVTHGTQVAIFLYDNKTTQFLNDMIFIM